MRGFLISLLMTTAAVAQVSQPAPVTIVAHPSSASPRIPANFIGLSFETSSLTSSTGFPVASPVFQQMISQLGLGLLRFGGNSVDNTAWMRGQRSSTTPSGTLVSSDVDRVISFARTTGWHVLWGLNLGSGTASAAADEANYVVANGNDVLTGFEIGNEPDIYASNGHRPSSYTVADYLNEWGQFADAIQAQTPGAVLTGPADASNISGWTTTFAQQYGSRIALLTQHYYPLAPISVAGPNGSNACTIANLLGAHSYNGAISEGMSLLPLAQKAGAPWRMAESNSCYDGGTTGVSDIFASALWGVDYMFLLASNAAAGVNFHGGGSGAYTPIAISSTSITARPLYYSLLMFQPAEQSTIVPLTLTGSGVNLTAYAVQDAAGAMRMWIINKDTSADASLNITPGAAYSWGQSIALAGLLSSTMGVTLGGATVAVDGSWSPSTVTYLAQTSGVYSAFVPAGSALLIGFGNASLSIGNSASGEAQVAPDSMASVYGSNLALYSRQATSTDLPTSLAGVIATVTDAAGNAQKAPLIYVSPSQVNLVMPAGVATGVATVTIGGASGKVMVSSVAPALFGMSGTSTAAATAARYPNGGGAPSPITVFTCASTCQPVPISLDSQSTVYLTLYGTGIRGAGSSGAVQATIGGITLPVQFAGAQGQYDGLDQVNVALPAQLKGMGKSNVVVTINGQASNAVAIDIN